MRSPEIPDFRVKTMTNQVANSIYIAADRCFQAKLILSREMRKVYYLSKIRVAWIWI